MSQRSAGSTMSFAVRGVLFFLALLGLAAAPPAEAKTIAIKAVFRYRAPDGTDKPVRYADAELRDSDAISDDIIARSSTELDGSVTFQYDSGLDDGWGGGRIDPFVRCYCSLMVPSGDQAVHKASVVWSDVTLQSEYFLNSPTWDNNNDDRDVSILADRGNTRHAFFQLDCLAEANMRRQIPFTDRLDQAPAAIVGDICAGEVDVDYPVTLGTGFQAHIGKI